MTIVFSNPRLRAEFNDWPLGGSRRGQCVFQVERHAKRGVRVGRTTTGKPKYTTYTAAAVIVDGSDGRTYILEHSSMWECISIRASDFMSPDPAKLGRSNTMSPKDAEYAEFLAMIVQSGACAMPIS